ncbi:MAG: hypothetical protein RIS45_537 [Planctomycetota bacterium]
MNPIVQYVLEVVVLPAVIATVAFSPFFFPPLRRRAWRVEAAVGTVFALTFLLSFITELDHRAVLRQVIAIEGDDAPFERWHRLGLVALLLIPAAWTLGFARRRSSTSRGMMSTLGYALVVSILCAMFVTFPGSSPLVQIGQGVLIMASIFAWLLTNQAVLWNAWVVFGVLAGLAGLGGFASLAVMCGALSVAGFGSAFLAGVGARSALQIDPVRSAGALAIVLGTLTALIARCGMAYDTTGVSPAAWLAAALLPLASVAFSGRFRRAERNSGRTFWAWLGVAIVAIVLLGLVGWQQSTKEGASDGGGDDYSDMYGG